MIGSKSLPSKIWELIDLAIHDIQESKKNGVDIDMAQYMESCNSGKCACSVCFAGSVLYKSLGKIDSVSDFSELKSLIGRANAKKLSALDRIRCGELRNAMEEFGYSAKERDKIPTTIETMEYSGQENETRKTKERYFNIFVNEMKCISAMFKAQDL